MALIQNDKDTEVSPSQSPQIIRQLDIEREQQIALPSALIPQDSLSLGEVRALTWKAVQWC